MRFDDSLSTVLAADTATGFGAAAAWRQLVDLLGRGRVPDVAAGVKRLRALRDQVPAPVRAASARALARTEPPAAMVALFAEDETAIAAPILRTARLSDDDWLTLLPSLSPAGRATLRSRRDLSSTVQRGLESLGATDFVLEHDGPIAVPLPAPTPAGPASVPILEQTPFIAVGTVARALPVVAEAMRQAATTPRSEIADLVARIDAFRQTKPAAKPVAPPVPEPVERFRFETDAAGVLRWVDVASRGALIGLTLAHDREQGVARVDATAGGALRARTAFRDVRLEIAGSSVTAGSWRLAGEPRFTQGSGRFEGLTGIARRPRHDEIPTPPVSASDSLRQLVHELRTPVNAIAGFSELIGTELLGPVPPVYRDRAQLIQRQAASLVAAIDDLDTAARMEGTALDLRAGDHDLGALLAAVIADLHSLAAERGVTLSADVAPGASVHADDRAVTRLLDRLLTALLAVAAPGERLRVQVAIKTRSVRLHVSRPLALPPEHDEALLAIDAEVERDGGPLLGIGFTLRLARKLAEALGGSLAIGPDRLTLRLPAAQSMVMERLALK